MSTHPNGVDHIQIGLTAPSSDLPLAGSLDNLIACLLVMLILRPPEGAQAKDE